MAYALVTNRQDASSDSNGYTSGSFNATGASLLTVGLSQSDTVGGVISDSQFNTYIKKTSTVGYASLEASINYAVNPSVSSSMTYTVSGTGNYPASCLAAWSGADTSAPFDQESGNDNIFVGSIQPGSVTPSTANQLVLEAMAGIFADGSTATIDGGFTITNQAFGTLSQKSAFAYLIQTTATAANPTWTDTALGLCAKQVTFKAASGGGGTTYNQSVSGGFTPSGVLVKSTFKFFTGTVTPAGTISKKTSKFFIGGITPSATLVSTKVAVKALTGALTFAGALTKQTAKTLGGALTFSGILSRITQKSLAGGLSFIGTVGKLTQKALVGVLTFSATLIANIVKAKVVTGVLSFLGTLATLLIPYVPGSSSGTRTRRTSRNRGQKYP